MRTSVSDSNRQAMKPTRTPENTQAAMPEGLKQATVALMGGAKLE